MDEYLSYVSSINKLLLKFQWLILFYYGAIFFFFFSLMEYHFEGMKLTFTSIIFSIINLSMQ